MDPTTSEESTFIRLTSAVETSRPDRAKLLAHCRDTAAETIARTLNTVVTQVEQDLLRRAEITDVRKDQRVMLDAMLHFRTQREQLVADFRHAFVVDFDQCIYSPDRHASPLNRLGARQALGAPSSVPYSPSTQLGLVEDGELTERLIISEVARIAKNAIDVGEMFGIRMRMADLLDFNVDDESLNPLGPEAIYRALLVACDCIPAGDDERQALLRALQPYVTAEMNRLYAELNAYLLEHNVTPAIRPVLKSRDAPQSGSVRVDARGFASSMSFGAYDSPNSAHAAGGFTDQADRRGGAGDVATPDARAIALLSRYTAERSTLVSALTGILEGPDENKRLVAAMLADPERHDFGHALQIPATPELITALGSLQKSPTYGVPGAVTLDPSLRQRSHPLDILTIEFVGLVFEGFAKDAEIALAIRSQIARLHIVAIKAALLDRSFFANRSHPMRRWLDRVAAIATDVEIASTEGSEFERGLALIVEQLVNEFTDDLCVFVTAARALDSLYQRCHAPIDMAVSTLAPEVEDKERVEAILTLSRAEIRRHMQPNVPPFVIEFLQTWWVKALAESHGRTEPAVDSWRGRREVLDLLVWSVGSIVASEVAKLALMLPRIRRELARGMDIAEMPVVARDNFFDALLATHQRAIERAKARTTMAVELAAQGIPSAAPVAAPPIEPLPDDFNRLIAELPRGSVVEVESSTGPRKLKLSWISPTRKTLLFASHAVRAHAVPAISLADALREGRARIVPATSQSILDRLIRRVTTPPTALTI